MLNLKYLWGLLFIVIVVCAVLISIHYLE